MIFLWDLKLTNQLINKRQLKKMSTNFFYLHFHLSINYFNYEKINSDEICRGPDLARSLSHPQNLLIEFVSSKSLEPSSKYTNI